MLVDDIQTERLVLRSTREEWGGLCVDFWLDEEINKYLSDPPREKAGEKYLHFAKGIEQDPAWYPFVAFHRETGAFAGTCSAVPQPGDCWDLGYCVHKSFWRQGYGTEMVRGLIAWGRQMGARSFTIDAAQENLASVALAKKLGFRVEREGSFRKSGTEIVYPNYIFRLDIL